MSFLILSILCSATIYVVFKFFGRFGLDTFQAIVVNYIVAAAFGFVYAGPEVIHAYSLDTPWLGLAALLGFMFITLFYLMAVTSQKNGVVVTGVATKMSMVIPAGYFILVDPTEGLHPTKLLGILLGVVSVYLASVSGKKNGIGIQAGLLPLLLFVGTGILDLTLAVAQRDYLNLDASYRAFVPIPFAFAAVMGIVVLGIKGLRHGFTWKAKNVVGGLILGVINYGSIYFVLRLLGSGMMDRSSAIPANNMGVVALSALAGFMIFGERLSSSKAWGIGLALAAIVLLTIGGQGF